jgi:hypothetical protein
MASIFGENSSASYQGAFRTTAGTALKFAGKDLTLVQNLQVSHQQPVQPLFEVGSNKRFYVVGKAGGTFTIGQVLGFGNEALNGITELANPCVGNRQLNLLIPNSYCTVDGKSGGSLSLSLRGVLVQQVGFTVASQDNLINSNVSGIMVDLEYTDANINP